MSSEFLNSIAIPSDNNEGNQINKSLSSSDQSTVSSSQNNSYINSIAETYDGPSSSTKAQYGASSTTWILGDILKWGEAGIGAWGEKTFKDNMEEIEKKRLEELYKEYPEFESGKYENDAAVWAGRAASMITDPVFYVMPWGWGAKAAAMGGKQYIRYAKLGTVGAGVGAGATTIHHGARTGEMPSLGQVTGGAALGGALSPVGLGLQKAVGAGLNKVFPNLFKQDKIVTGVIQKLQKEFSNKYHLNPKQLEKIYKIADMPMIRQLNKEVQTLIQTGQRVGVPKQIVKNLLNKSKRKLSKKDIKILQRANLNSIKSLKSVDTKTIKKNAQNIYKELDDLFTKSSSEYANKQHNLLIKVMEETYKAGGLTSAFVRALAFNITRPVLYMGGGAAAGTLLGDSEEEFNRYMWGGFALGLAHKTLLRGGIKGIPIPQQKGFAGTLKTFMLNTIDRNARIQLSMSQGIKLSQRGPIMDEFSNILFERFTEVPRLAPKHGILGSQHLGIGWGTKLDVDQAIGKVGSGKSIEQSEMLMNTFWAGALRHNVLGSVGKNFDKLLKNAINKKHSLIGNKKLTKSEQWALDTQTEAIQIARGWDGKATPEAQMLASKVKGYLTEFRKYYSDVGFTEAQLLENYFPRKFDFVKISKNREAFINAVAKAIGNIRNVKKWRYDKDELQIKNEFKGNEDKINSELAKNYLRNIEGLNNEPIISIQNGKAKFNSLPISSHIKFARKLKGSYKDVEEVLQPWLIDDIEIVLGDLTRSTTKSVEFARVFGPQGTMVNTFFDRLSKQYANAGWNKKNNGFYEGGHEQDAGAIRDAINSYFGKYHFNSARSKTYQNITATLSTLSNFKMMERVAISNIGDLVQGFQNSRNFSSAFKALRTKHTADAGDLLELEITGEVKASIRKSLMQHSHFDSDLGFFGGKRFSYSELIGASNEKFFTLVGLEGITKIARKYAFNVGSLDAHSTAKNIVNNLNKYKAKDINELRQIAVQRKDASILEDIKWLARLKMLEHTNGKILNSADIIALGNTKSISQALKNYNTRLLIHKAGHSTANRDAILPNVGNRLLFTQSRDPVLRLIGQFSSWAMAKSAQTNAMIQRVESGELRTAIGMLGGLVMFGAIKDFRDLIRTGKIDTFNDMADEENAPEWWSGAIQFSGMLGWLPTTILNQIRYDTGRPFSFIPAMQVVGDIWAAGTDDIPSGNFLKALDKIFPLPEVRRLLSRLGIPVTYLKDYNLKQIRKEPWGWGNQFKKNKMAYGGVIEQTRKLFNQGDVATNELSSFEKAFVNARDKRQELFDWEGNKYTTRRADENDQQYQNFLGRKTDNKVLLKEVPEKPADKDFDFNTILSNTKKDIIIPKKKPILKVNIDKIQELIKANEDKEDIIIPKKKPILTSDNIVIDKKEDIIIPKKKPILKVKKDDGFSLISKADASISEVPKVIQNFGKDETIEKTEISRSFIPRWSEPHKLLLNSFWREWFGSKKIFTNKDYDKKTIKVLQIAAENALKNGRNWIHYSDYPLNSRDVDAPAIVGEARDVNGELYSKEEKLNQEARMNEAYSNNILGQAKFQYDLATDPVMKAILSVGGFNIHKGENGYFISDRYNYNNANITVGTVLKKIRKLITHTKGAPILEGSGPLVNLELGWLNQDKNIKLVKKAKGGEVKRLLFSKGDTPSEKWRGNSHEASKSNAPSNRKKMGLLKSDLRISTGLLEKAAPDNHLLAYITPNERDMLIRAGGSGKMTPQGVPSFYVGEGMDFLTEANDVSAPSTDNQQDFPDYESGSPENTYAVVDEATKQKMIAETERIRGGGNVGSSGNNNNNNNITVKSNKTDTKTKKKDRKDRKVETKNTLEKFFDALPTGELKGVVNPDPNYDPEKDTSWDILDFDTKTIKSVKPNEVTKIPKPIEPTSLIDKLEEKYNINFTTNIPTKKDLEELDSGTLLGKAQSFIEEGPQLTISKQGHKWTPATGLFGYEGGINIGTDVDTTGYITTTHDHPSGWSQASLLRGDNKFTGELSGHTNWQNIKNAADVSGNIKVSKTEGDTFKVTPGIDVKLRNDNIFRISGDADNQQIKWIKSFKSGGLLDKKRG